MFIPEDRTTTGGTGGRYEWIFIVICIICGEESKANTTVRFIKSTRKKILNQDKMNVILRVCYKRKAFLDRGMI